MQVSLVDIWHNMGLPVRCVAVLLTLQAVACIAVAIDRVVLLARSSARARAFAAGVQSDMERGAYRSVLEQVALYKSNHLATFLELGLRSFLKRQGAGDSPARAAELARRALEREGEAISRDLNRGMNVLASTGSTAPFVGLLGTVLGIINAFKMIALTGSGGLGSIGSAISEALFVTAYGLIVAIPSVLVFNSLVVTNRGVRGRSAQCWQRARRSSGAERRSLTGCQRRRAAAIAAESAGPLPRARRRIARPSVRTNPLRSRACVHFPAALSGRNR